jgi:predicted RNA-binding Zn-ribbon protein involved in translation (DUF1610 family)
MSDQTCPTCGVTLVVRGAQIVQLPAEPSRTYVDYECMSPDCVGALRVETAQQR